MAGATTDFFSAKHKKLLRISAWANILAWIALIVYTLFTLSTILNFKYEILSLPQVQGYPSQVQPGVDTGYLAIGAKLITRVVEAFFPGVVYWLGLKGISVGLKMIVETDINYREIRQGEVTRSRAQEHASDIPIQGSVAEENIPVFYEPQEVLKIEGRLSWLAVIAVFAIILMNIPLLTTLEAIIRTAWLNDQAGEFLSWGIASGIGGLTILFQCLIAYYSLRALASILNILMEMESNSRGGATE
jgi:hypothetical protein